MRKLFEEKKIRIAFYISLVFKAAFALTEVIGGFLAYTIILFGRLAESIFANFVFGIIQEELAEDPKDYLANYFLHISHSFSLHVLYFVALYLIIHGIIKLWLIVGLMRGKIWYYPTSIIIFILFITYQLYRFTFTHSLFLLFISAIDLIVITLTLHEYRLIRKNILP